MLNIVNKYYITQEGFAIDKTIQLSGRIKKTLIKISVFFWPNPAQIVLNLAINDKLDLVTSY